MPRSRSEQESIIFAVTGHFEGKGYTQVTGNFDGAGWSVGFLQWNWKSGTLQPLLKAMHDAGPKTFMDALKVEHDGKHYDLGPILLDVCKMKPEQAIAWADARSCGKGKRGIVEPWKKGLERLLAIPAFQAIQRHHAQAYVKDARADADYYGVKTLRALALFFDIAVQNGMGKVGKIHKADVQQVFERLGGMKLKGNDRLRAIAQAVAETCIERFKPIVLSRKLAIVNGAGTVYGSPINLDKRFGLTDEAIV